MQNSSEPFAPPSDTYLYFPVYQDAGGFYQRYRIPDAAIQINRSTSLFLAGSDGFQPELRLKDPSATAEAAPMFTVLSAPLINVFNLRIWPDPGYVQANKYPDGPQAFRFTDPPPGTELAYSGPIEFEMLDSFLTATKVKIGLPGSYRFQAVAGEVLGSVDSIIDIDHPGADVVVVGGLFSSANPYQGEDERRIVTHCLSRSGPDVCDCGLDGCDGEEIDAIFDEHCDGEVGNCRNPCECESYFIWQKQGRLRAFSTGLISVEVSLVEKLSKPPRVTSVRPVASSGPAYSSTTKVP